MKKILFVLVTLFSATISFSQTVGTNNSSSTIINQDNRTVTGTVVDMNGDPLIGATVLVKGTTKVKMASIHCRVYPPMPLFAVLTLVIFHKRKLQKPMLYIL